MKIVLVRVGNVVFTADLTWKNLPGIVKILSYNLWMTARYRWCVDVKIFLCELFIIYPLAGLVILLTGKTDIIDNLKR